MVEADPENFREEAISAIANTVDLYEDSLRYYLKEYNIYWQDVEEMEPLYTVDENVNRCNHC